MTMVIINLYHIFDTPMLMVSVSYIIPSLGKQNQILKHYKSFYSQLLHVPPKYILPNLDKLLLASWSLTSLSLDHLF